MIREEIGGEIVRVPEIAAEIGLALPSFLEDFKDKLDFFFITTTDMIGEKCGTRTFREYLRNLDKDQLP